jgi:hypothetical protein
MSTKALVSIEEYPQRTKKAQLWVPYCWVVDSEKRSAWEYHSGGEPDRVEPEGVLRAGELTLQLRELFSEPSA